MIFRMISKENISGLLEVECLALASWETVSGVWGGKQSIYRKSGETCCVRFQLWWKAEKKEVRRRGQDDQLLRRMNAQRKERVQEQRRRERETMTREWHRTTYFLLADLRSTDKVTGKQLMSSMSQQMKILIQRDRSEGQLASSVSYEHLRSTARDGINIEPLHPLCLSVCLYTCSSFL